MTSLTDGRADRLAGLKSMSLREGFVQGLSEIPDAHDPHAVALRSQPPVAIGRLASATSRVDEPTPNGFRPLLHGRGEVDSLVLEMVLAREPPAREALGSRLRFERLRNRVCAAHMGFAVVASRPYFHRRGRLDFDDIRQLAALGLMRACETFDPTRGVAFRNYVATWVRQSVERGIANEGRIIRAPVHVQHARARCNRASAKFGASTGRAPSVDELSMLTGLSPQAIGHALAQPREVASLDAQAFQGELETVGDAVPSDTPTPLDIVLAKERHEHARSTLAGLPVRERDVVERHIAEGDASLEEIGATLAAERTGLVGLSRQRVRQIEQQGMDRLRRRVDKTLRLDG
jgi:RNA polymerase sigma factor (sigma-70 family)